MDEIYFIELRVHKNTPKRRKKINDKNNEQDCTEKIEFLFKCLDKFGRDASILFEQIDLCNSKNNPLNRLLFEYSEKSNFHFINSQLLKTVYQLESEMIEKAEKAYERFYFVIFRL